MQQEKMFHFSITIYFDLDLCVLSAVKPFDLKIIFSNSILYDMKNIINDGYKYLIKNEYSRAFFVLFSTAMRRNNQVQYYI